MRVKRSKGDFIINREAWRILPNPAECLKIKYISAALMSCYQKEKILISEFCIVGNWVWKILRKCKKKIWSRKVEVIRFAEIALFYEEL
jgi:hypothetical protein